MGDVMQGLAELRDYFVELESLEDVLVLEAGMKRIAALERELAGAYERAARAAMSARFGPPSSWGADRPNGWHEDGPCSPREAAMHDNGCVDAFRAIRALTEPRDDD